MLRVTEDAELLAAYYDIVSSPETKRAYCYMVGRSATLKGYECFPSSHGYIRDFRFMRGADWDFAFIPNQHWLLFYFRAPCMRLPKFSEAEIISRFPAAEERRSGEYKLRIPTVELADRVLSYVES